MIGTIGGRLDFPAGLQGSLGFFAVPILPGVMQPVSVPLRVAVPEDFASNTGPCQTALRVTSTPRMVAGMPMTDDVIKCQLKPVSASDYASPRTAEQMAELQKIFPQGVCDYSKPGVGDKSEPSMIWPSFGSTKLRVTAQGQPAPVPLHWRVGRSD